MIAGNLISNTMVPLRTSDTGDYALGVMSEFYVRDLPIVNDKQLLGLLSEDDILENDVEEAVGSYRLTLSHIKVREDDHLYEAMRLLAEYKLTVIPVIDYDDNYLGVITMEDILQHFARTSSFSEPGSIIVLGMGKRDYSLAEIARIVESEGAVILSSFITTHHDSTRIDVTIKINKQQVQSIISTLERFEYEINATFNELEYANALQERYDSFITYMNV